MDYNVTPEQEAWRRELQDFFKEVLTPEVRRRLDEENLEYMEELYQAFARRGYTALSIPKDYGGLGKGYMEVALFSEEALVQGMPHGVVSLFGGSVHFAANAFIRLGTKEQQGHFLPRIMAGQDKFTQAFTEPNYGSDLAGLETSAELDGDVFVVNGEKIFNSAHIATHMVTLVRTDKNAPKHRGISILIIPVDSPGITVLPVYTMRGWRRNLVNMNNVRVPRSGLLGGLNTGWYDLMRIIDLERSGVRGPAERRKVLEAFLDYGATHDMDGHRLLDRADFRDVLAEGYADFLTGWLLSYKVVWMQETGQDATSFVSLQKVYNSEAGERLVQRIISVLGPAAALEWTTPAARDRTPLQGLLSKIYKDARIWQVAGGSSEVQRNIIAHRVLGLPRG